MSQGMGRKVLGNAGLFDIALKQTADVFPAKSRASAGYKHRL